MTPGVHTVQLIPDATGTPAFELPIVVEAGTCTDVIGLGPRR